MSGGVESAAMELREFLKMQPHERVDGETFPSLLGAIARGWPDRDVQFVTDVQAVINEVIPDIRDVESRRAVEALAGDGDERYLSFKTRGTRAGSIRGVRYDAYRRAGSGRLHGDLVLLARAIEGRTLPPEPSEDSVSEPDLTEDNDREEQRALPRRAVLGAVGLVAFALAIVFVVGSQGESDTGSDGAPSESAAEPTTSTEPQPETPEPVEEAPPEVEPEVEEAEQVEQPAVDDPLLAPTVSGLGCTQLGQVAGSDPQLLTAASAIARTELEFEPDTCPVGEVIERGTAFWQRIEQRGRLGGGVLAYLDEQDEFQVVRLNVGQWQSYIRVGGGDGSRSTTLAGHPTGDVVEANGLFELAVTGDVLLAGEEPGGTYYWMPGVAAEVWRTDLRSDEPRLGAPTSSLYIDAGEFRVDFENGHMYQTAGGVIDIVVASEDERRLPDGVVPGSVISSIDGTAWYVDADLRRWWIADGVVWDCVGGGAGLVADRLRGYQIHQLAYGGVLSCPVDGPSLGVWPSEGGLNLWLYCRDRHGAPAESVDGGWECVGLDRIRHPVSIDDACQWQYGPDAIASFEDGDAFTWWCRNP